MAETVAAGALDGEGGYLDTGHLMGALKAHTVRGGAVTLTAQLARQLIGLGTTMVMARILLPSDYGLVAMVIAVTGFMTMFKDMGLSMATVQREAITQEQVSTLFWVNAGAGLLLTLVCALLAPLLAWFYRDPRLLRITVAVATGFLAAGLAVQHQALLQRQMRFSTLAMVEVSALCAQSAVGIGLALARCGYWALVFSALAGNVALAVGLWMACGWRPSRPARGAGVRSMLAFGGNLAGFNAVNYFARNLDNVLVGRVCGDWQLGLYSKAYSILLLPIATINAPIAAVAVPALSRLQSRPDAYKRVYLKVVSLIAFITMPVAAVMIVASQDLIRIVLGENWVEASLVFQLLGISALLQPIYNTQGWLHTSMGRTDRMFRWGLIGSTLIVASFVIGLPFGARGVALAYSCMIVVITWPCLWYALRLTAISLTDVVSVIVGPLVASLLAAATAIGVVHLTAAGSALARVAVVSASLSLVYLGLLYLLPSSRTLVGEFGRMAYSAIMAKG